MAEQNQQNASKQQGFAAMDEAERNMNASQGGSESSGNFKNDPGRASEAGRKGGQA